MASQSRPNRPDNEPPMLPKAPTTTMISRSTNRGMSLPLPAQPPPILEQGDGIAISPSSSPRRSLSQGDPTSPHRVMSPRGVLPLKEIEPVSQWLGTENMVDPSLRDVIRVLEVLGKTVQSLRELPRQIASINDALEHEPSRSRSRKWTRSEYNDTDDPGGAETLSSERQPNGNNLLHRAMMIRAQCRKGSGISSDSSGQSADGVRSRPAPLVGSSRSSHRHDTAHSKSSSSELTESKLDARRPSLESNKTDSSQATSVHSSVARGRRPSTHSIYSDALGCVLPNVVEETGEHCVSVLPSEASSEAPLSPGLKLEEPGTLSVDIMQATSPMGSVTGRASMIARTSSLEDAMSVNSSVKSRHILVPTSLTCAAWSVVLATTVAWVGFIVPVMFGFSRAGNSEHIVGNGVVSVFYVADILFIMDILLSFRTAVLTEDGTMLCNPLAIRRRYVSTWLLPDMFSAWPVSLTLSYGGVSTSVVLKVFVGAKLLRVLKLRRILLQVQCSLGYKQLIPLKVGLCVTISAHFLACVWRAVQAADPDHPMPLVSDMWWEQYVADIYFIITVMTTVGFGDIHPHGSVGRIYGIFCMLIGSAFFGFVISSISHFMMGLLYDEITIQVRKARAFMQSRSIPGDLRRRVEYNLRHQLKQERSMVASKLLGTLTEGVQRDLSLELLRDVVLKFPVFANSSWGFLSDIAQAHHWVNAMPGDIIVEEGQIVQELVFVVQGSLVLLEQSEDGAEENVTETKLDAGAWLGEQCLFESEHVRTCAAVAITTAELAVLSVESFHRIALKYPKTQAMISQMAQGLSCGSMQITDLRFQPLQGSESPATAWIWGALASLRRGSGVGVGSHLHPFSEAQQPGHRAGSRFSQ